MSSLEDSVAQLMMSAWGSIPVYGLFWAQVVDTDLYLTYAGASPTWAKVLTAPWGLLSHPLLGPAEGDFL